MKKRIRIWILGILTLILLIAVVVGVILFLRKEENYGEDENTLYSTIFEGETIRLERYDYVLGQNQIIGVERSTDNGKTYQKVTKEPITVSMEPDFIFLNKNLGFVITKPDLTKSNGEYRGIKVTEDGGVTFQDSILSYENDKIEIVTVRGVPYWNENKLKLSCSIYQVKKDNSGYETKELTFESTDNGHTWNLEKEK